MKSLLLLSIFFISCTIDNKKNEVKKITIKKQPVESIYNNSRTDTNLCVRWSDKEFRKMACGLFINKKGVIGLQNFEKPVCDTCICGNIYITNTELISGKKNVEEYYKTVPLNKIIDTTTLIFLNDLFLKDSKRVFSFFDTQEGGKIFEIEGADIKTFKTFDNKLFQYAYDKNYFYHRNQRLTKKEINELELKRE